MHLLHRYLFAALFLALGLFFNSCMENPTPVESQKYSVQIKFGSANAGSSNQGWMRSALLGKLNKPQDFLNQNLILSKAASKYDEVRVLFLDMTKWKDMQEFTQAWEATHQYSLFTDSLWREDRDDWDNITMMLKSYTGDYYLYLGDVSLSIEDNVAKGSIDLNPGLNYFIYAIRSGGKTKYWDESHAKILENEKNVLTINIPVINEAPNLPSNPNPADGAVNVPTTITLSWQCTDPEGEQLTYDVYFGTDANALSSSYEYSASYNPGKLSPNTKYYWRVNAWDAKYNKTVGNLWSFTTGSN